MISEERLTKSLKYLAETDEPCAKAKAFLTGLEEQLKTVFAIAFLNTTGTVDERKSRAYASESYKEHVKKIENATLDFELMRNKRNTESTLIECWRSMNANRRVGNL